MNRKSQELSMQTIVVIIILLFVLIAILTFVGSNLGDMLGGLGDFGSNVEGELDNVELP